MQLNQFELYDKYLVNLIEEFHLDITILLLWYWNNVYDVLYLFNIWSIPLHIPIPNLCIPLPLFVCRFPKGFFWGMEHGASLVSLFRPGLVTGLGLRLV